MIGGTGEVGITSPGGTIEILQVVPTRTSVARNRGSEVAEEVNGGRFLESATSPATAPTDAGFAVVALGAMGG